MLKGFHLHFIPHVENEHRPHALRHPSLLAIAGFLLILQIFFHFLGLNVSKVGASTTITSGQILSFTNQERKQRGLSTLNPNEQLTLAARNKGAHMLQKDYWAHTAPDGTTPWFWILNAGYNYLYAGENLAKDFVDTQSVVAAWMASPTHRNNILSTNFRDTGIAVIEGNLGGKSTTLIVQMFGQTQAQKSVSQNPSSNISIPVPDQTSPETPSILTPKDQSFINTPQPEIAGEAEKSSTVSLYDGEKVLGSIPADTEGAFSFRPETDQILVDGKHQLSADARDLAGNISERSKKIFVTIDTVPPKIIEDSLKIDYTKDQLGERFKIMIQLQAATDSVILNIGDYAAVLEPTKCEIETAQNLVFAQTLDENCNIYFGDLIPPAKTLRISGRAAEILAQDKAGNRDTYKFDLPGPVSKVSFTSSNSFFQSVFQNSASTLINTILAFIILGMFLLDSIIIYQKNIFRKNSHSSAHTLIILLGILTMLFLQNGNII